MVKDIAIRLSVLKEIQNFHVQLSDDIREKSAEYNCKVMQLREAGVTVQIADYYEANYGAQILQHLQTLVSYITDENLPHIKAVIAKLEEPFLVRDTAGNIVAKIIGDRIWDNSGNWLSSEY